MQKMDRHSFGKNFDVFPQNSTLFFIQILMIIANSCHSKIILGHAVFPFFKARGKYKQVLKFR